MSSSRGALPRSMVVKSFPHCVRIESDLTRGCGVNLDAGYQSLYRFRDHVTIDSVEYTVYRFSDRAEAEKFSRWTIGTLVEP